MSNLNAAQLLTRTVEELSETSQLAGLFHQHHDGNPLPSGPAMVEIIDLARAILFPGYFGRATVDSHTIGYHIGVSVERLQQLLVDQIMSGLCFSCAKCPKGSSERCRDKALAMSLRFIERLPEIRRVLATDVEAEYDGDPAASGTGEVILCYPTIKALTNYRVAHELLRIGVPLIPRYITEMAHSETGIDIHPGAQIGHHFMIDHGTGVVIGETCVIGSNVKLYQGVTLGAKSFPLDEQGNPIKGIQRHPIIEDNVIIYSNATILGRVTVGHDTVIGANVWITEDVKPYSKIIKN